MNTTEHAAIAADWPIHLSDDLGTPTDADEDKPNPLIVVASDIHGSAYWCARLMQRVRIIRPTHLVLLGDLLYHGPRNDLPRGYDPQEVALMLNACEAGVVAVRGNCDSAVDQDMLDFPISADYSWLLIPAPDSDLPGKTRTLFLTHGHMWGSGHTPPLPAGAWMLCGHTHVRMDETIDAHAQTRSLNPGSVSIPRDGFHSFAVIKDGIWSFEAL